MEVTEVELGEAQKLIAAHANEHVATLTALVNEQGPQIARACALLTQALLSGGKILACGNGGSAAEASHFAAEMVGRLERERPGLAAVSLCADAAVMSALGNDYGYDAVFAKQVLALGMPGDVLLAISTSGASANVVQAVNAARERDMQIVALLGAKGGEVVPLMRAQVDVAVCVPSSRTMRVQELHKLVVHLMCQWIDDRLLGVNDEN